jgi:hypothetical protein
MPQLSAHGAMVTTEDILDRDSKFDSDRARIKAFVSRNDVIAQLQSYGISSGEALARVDSFADREVALIADKLDQLPAGGQQSAGGFNFNINGNGMAEAMAPYLLIGAIVIVIIMLIVEYALEEGPNKPTYKKF